MKHSGLRAMSVWAILVLPLAGVYAQNLPEDLVYEYSTSKLKQRIIYRASTDEYFYETSKIKRSKLTKNLKKTTDTLLVFTRQGTQEEYRCTMGEPIMIARPALSNKVNWEVYPYFECLCPDRIKRIFRLRE